MELGKANLEPCEQDAASFDPKSFLEIYEKRVWKKLALEHLCADFWRVPLFQSIAAIIILCWFSMLNDQQMIYNNDSDDI